LLLFNFKYGILKDWYTQTGLLLLFDWRFVASKKVFFGISCNVVIHKGLVFQLDFKTGFLLLQK